MCWYWYMYFAELRQASNQSCQHSWRISLKFVDNLQTLREIQRFPDTIVNVDETPLHFDMPSFQYSQEGLLRGACTINWSWEALAHCHPSVHYYWWKAAPSDHIQVATSPPKLAHSSWCSCGGPAERVEWCITHTGVDPENPPSIGTQRNSMTCLCGTHFTGHMIEEVAEKLQMNNVKGAVIPGGCTRKKSNLLMLAWTNLSTTTAATSGWSTCSHRLSHKSQENNSKQHPSRKWLTG